MSAIADRVQQGLGEGFRRNAGSLLPPLVEALLEPVVQTDELVAPTEHGWPVAFDLSTSLPRWLAQLVGVRADPALTAVQTRELITTRAAWKTGTYQALVASIRTALVTEGRVIVSERDPDPWHAVIAVYATEYLPGTTDATITALAEMHRPAGMTFTYVFYPPSSYQEAEDAVDVADTTYADAEAAAGTYQSAED